MKSVSADQIEAVINKLGGIQGVEKFLRDELIVSSLIPTVDLDIDPYCPETFAVVEHKKNGQLIWDKEKVKLYTYERPKNAYWLTINGNLIRYKLESQPVMNANVLDFLLRHPELIPKEWKDLGVYFWGTIYSKKGTDRKDYLCVRYLEWYCRQWRWGYHPLVSELRYPSHLQQAALFAE